MKFSKTLIFLLMLFVIILLFTSCNEKSSTEPNESNKNTNDAVLSKDADNNLSADISEKFEAGKDSIATRGFECGEIFRYQWEFDHYGNIPGKIVGIWAHPDRATNSDSLRVLREHYGFEYVEVLSVPGTLHQYNTAVAAGYTADKMLGRLNIFDHSNWYSTIQQMPSLWGYYQDEPVNGGSPARDPMVVDAMMSLASAYLISTHPNSLFISGETNTNDASYFNTYVDYLMCTKYDKIPYIDPDQRSVWTDFRNDFGTQFSMSWISTQLDSDEYSDLLGHARNLNFDGIWLYVPCLGSPCIPDVSNSNLADFSYWAWYHGWLKMIQREKKVYYECDKPDPCDCNPDNLSDGWVVLREVYTGAYRDVYH